jgi:hypothetical protein
MSDRAPIQLVTNSKQEYQNAARLLAACANLNDKLAVYNRQHGEQCVAAMEEAALNGWAKNLPSTYLALRQIAFTNREGEDNPAGEQIANKNVKRGNLHQTVTLLSWGCHYKQR